MAVKFKPMGMVSSETYQDQVLADIRELLSLMLHAQVSGPDSSGNLEPVKRRLAAFVEERMVDDEIPV